MLRSTSQVNNERHDQKTHDSDDLDTGKYEFRLSIYLDGKDIQADNENDDDRDPRTDADVFGTFPLDIGEVSNLSICNLRQDVSPESQDPKSRGTSFPKLTYWMTMAAAEISAQRVIAELYQF